MTFLVFLLFVHGIEAADTVAGTYEIRPAVVGAEEEFERLADALQPGDELLLHGGTYSQNGRRAVTAKGTAERPIIIGGSDPSLVFVSARQTNLWPRPGSDLIGHADSALAPPLDFNGTQRIAPFDVGAYETDGRSRNPGWTIQAGFKR